MKNIRTQNRRIIRPILYLALLVLLNSCAIFEMDSPREHEFIIQNNSANTMTIYAYWNNYGFDDKDSLFIPSGKRISRFLNLSGPGADDSIFYNNVPDSVRIIFDNKRLILQYCRGEALTTGIECRNIEKNISNLEAFTKYEAVNKRVKGRKLIGRHYLVFDDSDYMRAVPL